MQMQCENTVNKGKLNTMKRPDVAEMRYRQRMAQKLQSKHSTVHNSKSTSMR